LASGRRLRQTEPVLGPLIMIAVLLLMPIAVIMTGAVVAGLLGFFVKKDVESSFEGSEYLELG
jgi:hypothetical protein